MSTKLLDQALVTLPLRGSPQVGILMQSHGGPYKLVRRVGHEHARVLFLLWLWLLLLLLFRHCEQPLATHDRCHHGCSVSPGIDNFALESSPESQWRQQHASSPEQVGDWHIFLVRMQYHSQLWIVTLSPQHGTCVGTVNVQAAVGELGSDLGPQPVELLDGIHVGFVSKASDKDKVFALSKGAWRFVADVIVVVIQKEGGQAQFVGRNLIVVL
mmetsp:Transcript_16095/g.37961  ORF Transcript_16095/g.37961 Transcript_16095/m.37961 type:complete len:214 (+) Transcript_16095:376-1017(+)